MVLNVLLPFTRAWDGGLTRPPWWLNVCRYTGISPGRHNSLEQHMLAQLGLDTGTVNSARRQQGLLHIYQTLCTRANVEECPLLAVS